MEIVWLPIEAVSRYENNPRNNARAVEKVAASIREYGWQQPIVVDPQRIIIAGDTRYQAAQLLGVKTIPVVVAYDLSPEKARAYRLADNKTSEFATWDDQKLAGELQAIMDSIGTIEATGFSAGEYEALAMQAEAIIAELDDEPVPPTHLAAPPSNPATVTDPAPSVAAPAEDDVVGPLPPTPNAPAMVPLNLLLTVEDRQAVFDAINRAKETHGLTTSAEALARICKDYTDHA